MTKYPHLYWLGTRAPTSPQITRTTDMNRVVKILETVAFLAKRRPSNSNGPLITHWMYLTYCKNETKFRKTDESSMTDGILAQTWRVGWPE